MKRSRDSRVRRSFQPTPTYLRLVNKHGIDPAAEWLARVAAVTSEPTMGLPMIAHRRPPEQTVLLPAIRQVIG